MAGTVSNPPVSTRTISIDDHARRWGQRADISARSTLVTILGDTVAPLGGTVWLNDLITLAAPFGFNERLVRTSMFRLVSERWVVNERVGRRSRYSLTPFGRAEFTEADARIYGNDQPAWTGEWTVVFLPSETDPDNDVTRHLRWRGFAELSRGVHAAPTEDVAGARRLVEEIAPGTQPLVASARFDDIAPLSNMAPFRTSSGLAEADKAYRNFIERYRWIRLADMATLSDRDAFATRTMVVHDLRRARLRDPALPRELLPHRWSGDEALRLAAGVYRAADDGAWRHVETVTGRAVDRAQPLLARRFAAIADQHPTRPNPAEDHTDDSNRP